MKKTFDQRIAAMNAMYKLPASDEPSLPANVPDRLTKFRLDLILISFCKQQAMEPVYCMRLWAS